MILLVLAFFLAAAAADPCPGWSAWSTCTVRCNGIQTRTRAGGGGCIPQSQTRACNPCPINCIISETAGPCQQHFDDSGDDKKKRDDDGRGNGNDQGNHGNDQGNHDHDNNHGTTPAPCRPQGFQVITRRIVTPARNGGNCYFVPHEIRACVFCDPYAGPDTLASFVQAYPEAAAVLPEPDFQVEGETCGEVFGELFVSGTDFLSTQVNPTASDVSSLYYVEMTTTGVAPLLNGTIPLGTQFSNYTSFNQFLADNTPLSTCQLPPTSVSQPQPGQRNAEHGTRYEPLPAKKKRATAIKGRARK